MALENLALQTFALLITAFLIPRFQVSGPLSGLIMVLALGFVNTNLWDVALFYQVPNTFTSQVIVTFFVNGLLFYILAKILPGVAIQGILPALVAPVVLTVVTTAVYHYGRDIDWAAVWEQIKQTFELIRGYSSSSPS